MHCQVALGLAAAGQKGIDAPTYQGGIHLTIKCNMTAAFCTMRQHRFILELSERLCMLTGSQAIAEEKSSCPNGEHSASVKVDLRILGAEDIVEAGTGQRGPSTSSRSLGGGSAGGSRRSMELGDPPGGPTTSTRSLGAVSAGGSSARGSRRSLEAGRRAAGLTLRAPKFVVPPGQLVGICGEVLPFHPCIHCPCRSSSSQ